MGRFERNARFNLVGEIETLGNEGNYKGQADLFIESTDLIIKTKEIGFDKYFIGDDQARYIFKVTLKRDDKKISIKFGQSIVEGNNAPDNYSILACLEKYDHESFDDFCLNYGYDADSRKAYKIYKNCVKQYNDLCTIFDEDEMQALQQIN